MSDFPTDLNNRINSATFKEDLEDQGMRKETEGGYTITRPRHTRTPRKTFTFGLTHVTDFDRVILDSFWASVYGTSDSFNFTHPVTAQVYVVRFVQQYQIEYRGAGTNYRWDVTNIKLEEV